MTPADRQRDDYERELLYLRNAGAAFARAHPAVAARLELSADQSADPHVERLLEGFAFLAARLNRHLDDSVSSLAANLLETLCPHAVRPVPSAGIARFGLQQSAESGSYTVEPGRELFGDTPDGVSIYFRTTARTEIWPLRVSRVRLLTENLEGLSSHPEMRSVLAVQVDSIGTFAPRAGDLGTLRFYVKGSDDGAARLCDLLYGHTAEVCWRRAGTNANGVLLPDVRPQFVGLDSTDAVLPLHGDTHPGLRLLLEYFAFPLKFQFFDLDCRGVGGEAPSLGHELLFVLRDRPPALELDPDALMLGCAPVVNLFTRTSEPIRIAGTQAQYRLVADSHRERSTEIYSIDDVASSLPGQPSVPVPRYFAYHGTGAGGPRIFWHAQRGSATRPGLGGSDMTLAFVDPEFDPSTPAARTLIARLQCTSRGLAQALPAGTRLSMEDAEAIATIELLHKPSAQSQAAPDGAARWKLVAQLSLNHLSLVDGDLALASLKELLALNNLTGSVIARTQIDALAGLACERVTRYVGDDPWQGYRRGYLVTLRLAPRPLRGASMLLFGAVLHRFLGMYAGINTFVELRLVHDDGRELFRWAAQPCLQVGL